MYLLFYFRWIAVVAVVTATTALIMISGKILYQLPPPRSVRHQFPTNPRLYFLSFGVALYAFNGACTFPTIQHDMKDPHRFTLALAISYICKRIFVIIVKFIVFCVCVCVFPLLKI